MSDPGELRDRMVAGLWAGGVLHDEAVAAALREVPRHLFLPEVEPGRAYDDDAVPTKLDPDGHPISAASQPAIITLMLEQLGVRPGHRVLEIGAGTGYNAALLARLAGPAGRVTTVDIDADLVLSAREHLAAAGFGQVRAVPGDGGLGWPPGAPYDRIIATVGASDITPAWFDQLAVGGRLVLPLSLGTALQYSVAFERTADRLESRSVLPCGFMRLRGAFAGPVTVVPLGGPGGLLAETAPRPAGAVPLPDLLGRPGEVIGTGVRVTARDLYGGLGVWLSLREPADLGRLTAPIGAAAAEGAAADGAPGGPGSPAAPLQPGMIFISSAHGAAVLVPTGPGGAAGPRAGRREAFEIGAQPFSKEGIELAERLAGQIRDWAAAGRPGLTGLRITACPAGVSPDGAAPAGRPGGVIPKRHVTLVLSWPEPGETGK
jgi:protein-L-isoaspartate(D-aspartate) O-methyltransferase